MLNARLLIILSMLAVGCSKAPDDRSDAASPDAAQSTPAAGAPGGGVATLPASAPDLPPGIDWFEGGVDDAFAAARAEGKPIYLYWGAEWCPPCHAIKATVFSTPEFRERSRLFVPVYLDGDTDNAQVYGENFDVMGYPTMIVFDSDGNEITRIPNGIDILAYANVLDAALAGGNSVAALVDEVLAGNPALEPDDCAMLAYHAWAQDSGLLEQAQRATAFRRMYESCPTRASRERTILYFSWLEALLGDAESPADLELSDARRAEILVNLETILSDYSLTKAALTSVLFAAADITAAVSEAGSPVRERLTAMFLDFYDRVAADETVYKRERIYTLAGRIAFERIDDPDAELSAQLERRIADTVRWADETTPSVYERQPIINALGNVLAEAGMDEIAKPLLVAELERTKQPYYFMPDIAGIEQRAGNTDAAMDWLRRAYETSQGAATRFQWGYYYVDGMLEMAPADSDLIHDTTVGIIGEMIANGGFYHRSTRYLDRLEAALIEWSQREDALDQLERIRASVDEICAGDPRAESRATCEAFLDVV